MAARPAADLLAKAAEVGLGFDAMNSNTFQDQPGQAQSYKFGSLSNANLLVYRGDGTLLLETERERAPALAKKLTLYKLRSMRLDAEASGAKWAEMDDPRITRLGRFIRKVRIDELPQTWSVLKGEMSFVGPRPERPQFVDDLEQKLPYYAERHMVKPGITGWAQINYPYGASVEDSRCKLEYDLYYAKNYTPFLDLVILLQTVRVVLWPEGAR